MNIKEAITGTVTPTTTYTVLPVWERSVGTTCVLVKDATTSEKKNIHIDDYERPTKGNLKVILLKLKSLARSINGL